MTVTRTEIEFVTAMSQTVSMAIETATETIFAVIVTKTFTTMMIIGGNWVGDVA